MGLGCAAMSGCAASASMPASATHPASGSVTASTASCAALTPAQQRADAPVVFDGIALKGPAVAVTGRPGGRVLLSPARFRVFRYAKGRGPSVVRVDTAASAGGGGYSWAEDGIEPVAGQRWRIYGQPHHDGSITTSDCAGSHPLGIVNRWVGGSRRSDPGGADALTRDHWSILRVPRWNPHTRRWTRGPRAPQALAETPAAWTGRQLLALAQDGRILAYGR